ncbi:MAG: class I SAM-dependent methyltransferase [Saccharospirillum sp.]|uniref:class I SAM-dependent methyltransferase n=1 Tax=Saccharospirillum sp. TaxID=2033801 RepID=UPI003297B384
MKTQEQDNRWTEGSAHWYADNYGDWPTTRMPIDAVEWQNDETVLDVGCGTGSSLRYLLGYCPKGRLVGLEPTPAMLEIARQQTDQAGLAERIELFNGAAESIPLADASVDSVLAFSTYHHWQDIPAGLAEIARVLKPGGRLLVSEEPEIQTMHGITIADIQAQCLKIGFRPGPVQRLNEGKAECNLILAYKD